MGIRDIHHKHSKRKENNMNFNIFVQTYPLNKDLAGAKTCLKLTLKYKYQNDSQYRK